MSKLKTIIINLLILIAGLVLIELFFGGWFNDENQLRGLNIIKNQVIHYSTDLYSQTPVEIEYSRDEYGLRGKKTFNSPEKIDILTVGGSTTDQRYISDGGTWQDLLEKKFEKDGKEVLISNAGVDGQSTFGHIKNFEIWFPKIPGLQPNYILFYIGINDFYRIRENSEYDKLTVGRSWKNRIENNSVLYNLLRTINGMLATSKEGVGHQKMPFEEVEYTDKGIAESELIEAYKNHLEAFENRISVLIELTEDFDALPIFVTQPSFAYQLDEQGNVRGITTMGHIDNYSYNGVDYYHLLALLNESIRNAAGDEVLIVDLTSRPVWKQEDFYDFFHNTPEGAEKVADEIYVQIKDYVQ